MIRQSRPPLLAALLARVVAPTTNTTGTLFSSAPASFASSSRAALAPVGLGSAAPSAPEAASADAAAASSPADHQNQVVDGAAAAAAAEARAALRAVLRAVDAHFISVAGNRQWRDYVLEQARKGRAEAESARRSGSCSPEETARWAAAARKSAEAARDYAALVETVARHRRLMREYNIGLDPDERNRQMVEKTAARVGFSIPKGREEGEEGEEEEGAATSAGASGGGPSIARRAAMARAAGAAAGRAASSPSSRRQSEE